MGVYGSIRCKGTGKVSFKDEEKRPIVVEGEIVVDWDSVYQPPYVKVKSQNGKELLLPFERIVYIEWIKREV